MTKAQAQSELAALVAPLNSKRSEPSERKSFGDFVRNVYLPFYRRKWKRTTTMTNEDRLAHHLTSEFDPKLLGSFDRDELQVNENVYTITSMKRRKEAVNALERAIGA